MSRAFPDQLLKTTIHDRVSKVLNMIDESSRVLAL